jgi:hypothetical protein
MGPGLALRANRDDWEEGGDKSMASVGAYLSVWSSSLTINDLAEALGPDGRMSQRGNLRDPPRNLPDANGWSISIHDDDTADPASVLERLLDHSSALRPTIGELRFRATDLDVRVGLTVRPGSARLPFHFTRELVEGVQALGASFDIDLSF